MPVFKDDPYGTIKDEQKRVGASPREVNQFHNNCDADTSQIAQHHTLGVKHDQASPGDHSHDGGSSRKAGANLGLVLTGAKGGNVALTNLITMLKTVIEFTDSTT